MQKAVTLEKKIREQTKLKQTKQSKTPREAMISVKEKIGKKDMKIRELKRGKKMKTWSTESFVDEK